MILDENMSGADFLQVLMNGMLAGDSCFKSEVPQVWYALESLQMSYTKLSKFCQFKWKLGQTQVFKQILPATPVLVTWHFLQNHKSNILGRWQKI